MVLFIGAKHFKNELNTCFSSLCKDPNVQVRKTVSGGFHEVCYFNKAIENYCSLSYVFIPQSGDIY